MIKLYNERVCLDWKSKLTDFLEGFDHFNLTALTELEITFAP